MVSATNYYVSSSDGNDAMDGRSPSTAWKTISKVNGTTFSPGDSILFKRGDTWRETLVVSSSGNSGAYIIFSSYGSGINPRIVGSVQAASWTETASASHIWQSATSVSTNPYTGKSSEIFFENTDGTKSFGTYKSSTGSLSAEFQWTWQSNNIYVYSTTDPTLKYASVEVPQRESSVNMNKKNYIHFDGIDILFAVWSGYGYDVTHNDMYEQFGLIIENSEIGCIGAWEPDIEQGYGIEVVYTNMVVRNNKFHDCGRRGFAMDMYGNGYTAQNITVEGNEFYNGYHTTGCDIDVGAGYNASLNNITVRNNYFHETSINRSTDLSNLIFVQNNNTGACKITNLYIYNNIFKWPNGYGILMENAQSVFIYNNVFYDKNPNASSLSFVAVQGSSVATVKNNIFYKSSGSSTELEAGGTTTHDYNLFYNCTGGSEAHGITSQNPNFVSSSDFHLQPGSPAIGAGIAIPEVTSDYEGIAYGNPPNMGCYATPVSSNNPVYLSSLIGNATPSLLEMTYNKTLANIVPAASAFTVMVNSVARAVNTVAVSGTKVQLTLATPVVYGDVITVSYTKPTTNPLQIATGEEAASISSKPVTNNVAATIPVYVSSVIANTTPSILTMTYSLSLANIVPAVSAFAVQVNSVDRAVSSVSVSGTTVQLTLSSPVIGGDVVTVSYTKPATNPLQTSAGDQAASISAKPVTNNVVTTIPVYVSSVIANATPTILTMTYSLSLANIVPAASAFTVQVNSVNRTVSSVSVSGTSVQLTLASPVIGGDVVTVSYTKPASNPLQTSAGGQAASISSKPVTNNVTTPIPAYVSSVIENATPNLLTITYSLSLANIVPAASAFTVMVNSVNRNVSSVSISGTTVQLTLASPVINGDIVTVAYTKPSSNPLQTSAGGQAVTIAAQPVTNNVVATVPVYVSSVIENATPSLLTMTYSLSLANVIPAVSAFTVQVNSVNRTVNAVTVSGIKVLLTLASPVVYGDVITVAYTRPVINPLQSTAGGQATSITSKPVTNNCTLPVPVYVSSVVEDATPTILQITYNLTLANIVPSTSAFRVRVNSYTRTVTKVTISGTTVQLTLASRIASGDVVTVAYTRPSTNPLQTAAGGKASSFSAKPVTNNVKTIVAPVYMSSVIQDATPANLEMIYDLTLANIVPATSAFTVMVNSSARGVTAVVVSGNEVTITLASPVIYGDIVTVAYTKPSLNPLQTPPGGQAATIGAQPVTNNINNVSSPNNPVYISSVVQDATPTLLVMTYDRALNTTIVPATSAFLVMVNSESMPVTSITISGSSVRLTLGSAIVNGDVVTVSYTKPASNPLQSATGGWQAASITDQPVTNNTVLVPLNNPPVPVIVYATIGYSGFVYDIDATASYDTDNDPLIFLWTAPETVAISSTSTSKIQFLAPVVQEARLFEFTLSISDGESIQTQIVPITILPYKPGLQVAKALKTEASSYDGTNYPGNIVDGNPQTQWSADGNDQWLIVELNKPFRIDHLGMIFPSGLNRSAHFDIYAAKDTTSWNPVLTDAASCNFSGNFQVFVFPESQSTIEYSFIKLVGHGNSADSWNYFSELQVFGTQHVDDIQIRIYPNPAQQIFNIAIEYPSSLAAQETAITSPKIRIFNTAGTLVYEQVLDPGSISAEIPISFNTGIYLVQLLSGNVTVATNKLIVIN